MFDIGHRCREARQGAERDIRESHVMAKKNVEKPSSTEKPGTRKEGLLKPQVEALKVLSKVKAPGGLTRNEIAGKIGYKSSVAVYQTSGWPNVERRKEWEAETGHESLLTLGYVEEEEGTLKITAKGRAALKAEKE